MVKTVDLNLAARYDGYSDVGSTTNWRASVRWQPTQQLLLRGSTAPARAPTLNNLFEPQTTQTSATIQDGGNLRPGRPQQLLRRAGERTHRRQPEAEARDLDGTASGLVFQPMPSLAVGFDWFNIQDRQRHLAAVDAGSSTRTWRATRCMPAR